MSNSELPGQQASFLGVGWSFPPSFSAVGRKVNMTADEEDIAASLKILFYTALGERFLQPTYGLELTELMFEPISTTMRTYVTDRIRIGILIHEPRIELMDLQVDSPDPNDGTVRVLLDYKVRATNSRFNVVFPFRNPA